MRRRRRRVPKKPASRATPPIDSQGDVPVKARDLTVGGVGEFGFGGTTAGAPLTVDSLWASSTTTAADGLAAAVWRLLAAVVGSTEERPLNSWTLTPSATALADLPSEVVLPSATVIVDSRGVPWRIV